MDSAVLLENWKAAGMLVGLSCAEELKKLAGASIWTPAKKDPVIKHLLKQMGTAAMQSAIGATVGTTVGSVVARGVAKGEHKKEHDADKNLATMAPKIFRAGFQEGMRHGLAVKEKV